jgi:hypothetical protein
VLGNVTATHVNVNETITRLTEASAEFKRRMAETPAQLRLAPWFGGLESGIGKLLDTTVQDIGASSYCPAHCLDMSPVASKCQWVLLLLVCWVQEHHMRIWPCTELSQTAMRWTLELL